MSDSLILLIIIPFLGACGCLVGKVSRHRRFAPILCLLTILACIVHLGMLYPEVLKHGSAVYVVGGWQSSVGINQYFDGLTWIGCALVLTFSFLVLLFAMAEREYDFTFYFFYLLMVAGMNGVLLAADLFNMFVFFEILGISSYIFIAYNQEQRALFASFQYLMLSTLGIVFFLIGIFLIYQQTGTLSLLEAGKRISTQTGRAPSAGFAVAALIAGISVRTAYFPFHTWLPDAYSSAPHPVSAILSGAVGKISFLVIWRLVFTFQAAAIRHLFLWLGAATALIGVFYALSQTDCKKLLAWHSISQVGYILTAFGIGQSLALVASLYHLMNHALFKTLLFLCIGSMISVTGERNVKHLGQLGKHFPGLMTLFIVGAFSISGIPLFNGFISKKMIESSVTHHAVVSAVLWLAGIGTMASFFKLSVIFRKNPYHSEGMPRAGAALPSLSYIPLVTLAVLCVLTGLSGTFVSTHLARLLSGEALTLSLSLYTRSNFVKIAISLGLGYGLYRFIVSQAGQRFTTRIQRIRLRFETHLIAFLIGFMLLVLVMRRGI